MKINLKSPKTFVLISLLPGIFLWFLWPIKSIFRTDYSTLVFDCNHKLLRATLASDHQYRFPPDSTDLSEKYITALLNFEDHRFYYHPGVDPLALVNAMFTNFKAGKRIRGGSTITMQVARLAQPKARTYFNKLRECLVALKYTLHFSKDEILRAYANHIPLGGNIVGIQAASYRYYGKPVTELTWAESALFAVLPNSPSMINLSRQRQQLIEKRNRLLKVLQRKGIIDKTTYELACREPLPEKHQNLPFVAPHFTQFVTQNRTETICHTSLNYNTQLTVENAAKNYALHLQNQGIPNLAVLVAETQTGKIRAYVGSQSFQDSLNGGQVDGVQAHRSTGSLLKPFLVAKALDRGPYTMESKIQDVPTFYGTFAPQNYDKQFSGLVTLEKMLIHSLNVPAVRLLNAYGVEDFYDVLVAGGFKGLFRSPNGYGLTLILGGAEASLWELVQLYQCLGNFGKFQQLTFLADSTNTNQSNKKLKENRLFSKGAAWLVMNSLSKLNRPGSEFYWNEFNNQVPVAWKTGTSYGQKDGWAIGVNPQWTIGVWVGNFTGEGNANIGGAKSAAPLLFTLFSLLTRHGQPMWFEKPLPELRPVECCKQSGYPAGRYCTERIILERPWQSYVPGTCPYHRRFLIDRKTGKSVCSLCWSHADTTWVTRCIVPAAVRDVFVRTGQAVDDIPVHSGNCPNFLDESRLELVYPVNGIKIFIPRDFDGEYEKVVFSAKHHQPDTHLFWYLDGALVGETVTHHQVALTLEPGKYELTVQDEEGFERKAVFSAYRRE